MTQRTDIHRPAEFNPTQYRVIDYIDNKRPDPPIGGNKEAYEAYDLFMVMWKARIFEHFPDWCTGGDDHVSIFQCNHCGHPNIRYVAVVEHIPTGARLAFGETCADRCELPGRDAFKAKYVKDAAAKALARYEKEAKRAAYRAANGELVEWLEAHDHSSHEFVCSMKDSLSKYGDLTEKQTAAITNWMLRDKERTEKFEQRKAEEKAQLANVAPLSEGRYVVEGEVLSTKVQEGDYGSQLKMLVRMDDGNKVWGTVPQSILDALSTPGSYSWEDKPLKGRRVSFTAKVQRSNDDQHFGFYSRPTNGAVMFTAAEAGA